MYVLPLLSTLLAALFAGFGVSRSIGYRGVTLYSSFSLFVACVSSLTIWYEVVYAGGRVELDLLGPWFTVGSFNATWTLRYDILAAHMLATVTTVSFAVHLYALNYMRGDPHLTLFMCYLSLFTHCMLLLVTADNLLVTMVGWEGIGVCSYLLIGYYTHRLSAVKAAQQAILVNRISDGMLLWGILWVWHHTGSLEYDLVNSSNASSVPVLLGVAILIGAMGKSAQVLFHVWLPNAMEGGLISGALHFLWCFLGICMFWYCFGSFCDLFAIDWYCFGSFCDLFAIDCFNLCRDLVSMEQFVYSFATVVATNKLRQTTVSDYQQQAICGLLLGDASLSDPNSNPRGVVSSDGSYRMEFTFKQASLDFTRWVKFQVLGNLATKSEPTPYPRQEPTQYTFSSSQFSYFTKLAAQRGVIGPWAQALAWGVIPWPLVMWYVPHPNPTPRLMVLKILPPTEYLEQQFTAVALAFLIMSPK